MRNKPSMEDWDAEAAELAVVNVPAEDEDQDPEAGFHQQQAIDMIAEATKSLLNINPLNRQCVYWAYFKSLSFTATGEKLNMTRFEVARRVSYGLAQIREALLAQGHWPSAELYKAIANVDTKDLFEHPEPLEDEQLKQSLSVLGKVSSRRADIHRA